MKLGGSDAKDIILWGTGGLAAAVLYQFAAIWVRQKTNVQDLTPLTEALYKDRVLFNFFCQLKHYRYIDEKCFKRAVNNADRLVLLSQQISDVGPSIQDRQVAYSLMNETLKNLEGMLQSANKLEDPRPETEINRLYVLIFKVVEKYWTIILRQTQNVNRV